MAKPNYRQQKRQKELTRKSRQAEKLQRRSGKLLSDEAGAEQPGAPDGTAPPQKPT